MLSGTYLRQAVWVAPLRFGPFHTPHPQPPRFLPPPLAPSVDSLAPNLISGARFHTLPLFLSQQAERSAAAQTAALIRNQLAPRIPGPPAGEAARCHLHPAPAPDGISAFPLCLLLVRPQLLHVLREEQEGRGKISGPASKVPHSTKFKCFLPIICASILSGNSPG